MSLVKNENIATNKNELEVFVDSKTFNLACDKAYKKRAKKISVPGFRVGKAPRRVIEKRYGEGVFFDDAIEIVYPEALEEAIQEANLDAVAIESLEPTEVSTEKGLTFKAVCVLKPEVEVENYKGIEVEKPVRKVDDKAVNSRLQAMRERCGRMISVEDRAAEQGDTVVLDFEGFIDGVAFDGGKAEGHTLKLGSGQFIPGFEDQVVGHNIEDEFDVNVTFPEDYHVEDLKSKPAVFKCKIHEIKKIELPEEDDEFAKDVSEYDTLNELKKDLENKIEEEYTNAADMSVEHEITSKLIENMKAEIPSVMFDRRIDELMRDFEQRISMQGITLDMYAQYMGTSKDKLRDQFREQAETQVKSRLALEKIADIEKIEVSDDEINGEFEKLSKQYNIEAEKIKTMISSDNLKADILVRKAMDFVKDNAKITDKLIED